MKIKASSIPDNLLDKIKNPDPIEGEDILIEEDDDGSLIGVILQPRAYEFFLKKIDERENELDSSPGEAYSANSRSFDDILKSKA